MTRWKGLHVARYSEGRAAAGTACCSLRPRTFPNCWRSRTLHSLGSTGRLSATWSLGSTGGRSFGQQPSATCAGSDDPAGAGWATHLLCVCPCMVARSHAHTLPPHVPALRLHALQHSRGRATPLCTSQRCMPGCVVSSHLHTHSQLHRLGRASYRIGCPEHGMPLLQPAFRLLMSQPVPTTGPSSNSVLGCFGASATTCCALDVAHVTPEHAGSLKQPQECKHECL